MEPTYLSRPRRINSVQRGQKQADTLAQVKAGRLFGRRAPALEDQWLLAALHGQTPWHTPVSHPAARGVSWLGQLSATRSGGDVPVLPPRRVVLSQGASDRQANLTYPATRAAH